MKKPASFRLPLQIHVPVKRPFGYACLWLDYVAVHPTFATVLPAGFVIQPDKLLDFVRPVKRALVGHAVFL